MGVFIVVCCYFGNFQKFDFAWVGVMRLGVFVCSLVALICGRL